VTVIDEVIEFYRARLAETGRTARQALTDPDNDRGQGVRIMDGELAIMPSAMSGGLTVHFVRHDPARALKKVTAGRQLIRLYEDACERIDYLTARGWEAKGSKVAAESYANAILVNATEWDDHQDWDAAWRPGWMDEPLPQEVSEK
jgi:hypothetical protein